VGTVKEMKHGWIWEVQQNTLQSPLLLQAPAIQGVEFTLSAALVDQEEESFSPKLAISFVYADGTVALNIDDSQLPGPVIFRERRREAPRREEKRLAVWLKYPNAIFFFSFSLFKILYLCSLL
jgi:hypothetical protein